MKVHKLESIVWNITSAAFFGMSLYYEKEYLIVVGFICIAISKLSRILNSIDRGDND